MTDVSVRELRANLRQLVERAAAGEEISILRRGRRVARLVPPERSATDAPDLTEFRASITVRGEPLSKTVIRQRRDARY
jgi:prevent-host-death family protein